MLISSHIPKTAGTTLRRDLTEAYGGRVFWDYGDAPEVDGPEVRETERVRREHIFAQRERLAREYDAIHGHIRADKYRPIFPDARLAIFLRDPYQHAYSSYANARRETRYHHPGQKIFLDRQMSIVDMIAAFPDHQTVYLGEFPLEAFDAVGIVERYDESLALYERVFGIAFAPGRPLLNANAANPGAYAVDPEVRAAVDAHRARDVENYRLADERLTRMLRRYGI